MYSLSTCWNSHRHTDGAAMLREIRQMGFEYAELSHGIRLSLLPGIFQAVEAGEIKISTLHNFCPLPIGINFAAPNLYKFSSLDRRERENAIRHTLKTFDTAVRVQAQIVVLHLGSVEMKDYTDKLIGMCEKGQRNAPKYERICQEVVEKREHKKEKHLAASSEVLRELVDQAGRRGLKLGIENREGLEEIPFETDFAFLFKDFPTPVIGYWHDTGHAQIKENLGFIHHAMHLESMARQLIGFHIHDVQFPARDHCPPGTGTINFQALQPFVKPEHVKVFEMSPGTSADQVLSGISHLKSLWGPE